MYILKLNVENTQLSNNMNLAEKVLHEVYSQGDYYFASENDKEWYASFSNEYPLQHGRGWSLTISKTDYSFVASKRIKKTYGYAIQEAINNATVK